MLTKDYYNDFFEIGQQKINFRFFELGLPDDDPVYTLKNVMEELDFSRLLACPSSVVVLGKFRCFHVPALFCDSFLPRFSPYLQKIFYAL